MARHGQPPKGPTVTSIADEQRVNPKQKVWLMDADSGCCREKRLAPGVLDRRLGRCLSGLNDFHIDHLRLDPRHQQFVGKHPAGVADRQGAVRVGTDFLRGTDQATLPACG